MRVYNIIEQFCKKKHFEIFLREKTINTVEIHWTVEHTFVRFYYILLQEDNFHWLENTWVWYLEIIVIKG